MPPANVSATPPEQAVAEAPAAVADESTTESAPAAAPEAPVEESPQIDAALLAAIVEVHAGSYDGIGASKFKNGNSYSGSFVARAMSGKGEYTWTALGVKYKGDFDQNRLKGKGLYEWPDGSSYLGDVVDGLREGYGVYTGPNGMCRYSGDWRAGQRHGKGKLEYDPDGKSWYEGEWVSDEKHGQVRSLRRPRAPTARRHREPFARPGPSPSGAARRPPAPRGCSTRRIARARAAAIAAQGTMVYKSGNTYVGAWAHNVKSGFGEMRWASSAEVYRGQWAHGLQDGEGEHEWLRAQPTDGALLQLRERYAGQWLAGQRSGQGIFVYANGAAYHGGWRANQKHGEGVFLFEDGSEYRGPFSADRMLSEAAGSTQPAAPFAELDGLAELVASEKEPAVSTKNVVHALTRFTSEIKRTYRFYAALHCAPADAFTLHTEQLDAFLHDTAIATVEFPLAVAHRVFFGSQLRPGVGHAKPAAPPKPSMQQLVDSTLGRPEPSADARAAALAGVAHEGTRPILLREFTSGLVRLAHARHAQLPSLAQRVHELLTVHLVANTRSADAAGAQLADDELERAWPAVRAVRDARDAQLRALWAWYARPRDDEMPAHRQRSTDGTMRCRAFGQLLRDAQLVPAPLDLQATLSVRVDDARLASRDRARADAPGRRSARRARAHGSHARASVPYTALRPRAGHRAATLPADGRVRARPGHGAALPTHRHGAHLRRVRARAVPARAAPSPRARSWRRAAAAGARGGRRGRRGRPAGRARGRRAARGRGARRGVCALPRARRRSARRRVPPAAAAEGDAALFRARARRSRDDTGCGVTSERAYSAESAAPRAGLELAGREPRQLW